MSEILVARLEKNRRRDVLNARCRVDDRDVDGVR